MLPKFCSHFVHIQNVNNSWTKLFIFTLVCSHFCSRLEPLIYSALNEFDTIINFLHIHIQFHNNSPFYKVKILQFGSCIGSWLIFNSIISISNSKNIRRDSPSPAQPCPLTLPSLFEHHRTLHSKTFELKNSFFLESSNI